MSRSLAIALLNDEQGINYTAWKMLREVLDDYGDTDIVNAVISNDDRCPRFRIPENIAKTLFAGLRRDMPELEDGD